MSFGSTSRAPAPSRPAGLRGQSACAELEGRGPRYLDEMSDTSLPVENTKEQEEEEEEAVTGVEQGSQLPSEGCVSPTVAPVPSEGEPGPAAHAHCQAWLLDMLDDVRYLISCTNWY